MAKSIRILIVDDHPVVRHGLHAMLEQKPGIQIIGEARNGLEAIEYTRSIKPDVILMDLVMPVKDGLEAIVDIHKQDPQVRILVLTSYANDEKIVNALKMGAKGCLLKESTPDELLRAIRDVYNGEMFIPSEIALRLVRVMSQPEKPRLDEILTKREADVLKMAVLGYTNSKIANELNVTEGTVRFHFSHILSKLYLSNRTQAVLYAVQQGWASITST